MAATHTYVVTTVTGYLNTATVIGTVDTIPSTKPIAVTVLVSLGDVLAINASGGVAAIEKFIAPLMLSAAINAGLPAPTPAAVTQLPTGTFSLNGITYVISTITAVGDTATITGTVNGTAVTITTSVSGLSATLAISLSALENLVAGPMLAAAVKAGLTPATVAQVPTGTFTL